MINKSDTTYPKVLVIEDDQSVSRMLRLCLNSAGFEITGVSTGRDALRVLDRDAVDAVILDLALPDGLGGAVLDRLRTTNHEDMGSPVWVVISTLDSDEASARYGHLGGHFLAKPFDPWDLIKKLQRLIPAW